MYFLGYLFEFNLFVAKDFTYENSALMPAKAYTPFNMHSTEEDAAQEYELMWRSMAPRVERTEGSTEPAAVRASLPVSVKGLLPRTWFALGL